MRMIDRMLAACAVLLFAGTALAAATPQQKCNYARITAWKKYQACVDGVVAKGAKGIVFDDNAAFAKCRHKYFSKWASVQSYVGSTCVGARFTDNGDATVTDNLSELVWEKKENLDATPKLTNPHDADNTYQWSTGAPYKENGAAFSNFLADPSAGLAVAGFAGANGWRLPTVAELQTIVLDFECKGESFSSSCLCPSTTCIDPALDSMQTPSESYWSATGDVTLDSHAWFVAFSLGFVAPGMKTDGRYVRAVRGGL